MPFASNVFVLICILCNMMSATTERADGPSHTDTAGDTQVVLYKPPALLKEFNESFRTFEIAGRPWRINQDWHQEGVAGVVWEAAIVLSQYLETHTSFVVGKNVVELGSGTGLVGMVASALGALAVMVTDRHIEMAQCNVDLNSDMLRNLSVVRYSWGETLPEPLSAIRDFDLILGADIIYIEDTYPYLLESLSKLSTTDTVILLASKHRYDKTEKFLHLSEKFFHHSIVAKEGTISIYELRKIN